MRKAALGFRSKTGRAIAIVLADGPSLVWRGEVSLIDESYPATIGPYHTVMELPWKESLKAVQPLIESIQAATDRMFAALLEDMRARDVIFARPASSARRRAICRRSATTTSVRMRRKACCSAKCSSPLRTDLVCAFPRIRKTNWRPTWSE
jgi:hypothetical protein